MLLKMCLKKRKQSLYLCKQKKNTLDVEENFFFRKNYDACDNTKCNCHFFIDLPKYNLPKFAASVRYFFHFFICNRS